MEVVFSRRRELCKKECLVTGDIEIRTYKDIPYEAHFLGSDSEGDDMTFAVVEEPKKGAVAIVTSRSAISITMARNSPRETCRSGSKQYCSPSFDPVKIPASARYWAAAAAAESPVPSPSTRPPRC